MECSEKLLIDISEVVCGDPNCAPIDTVVSLVWETGGRGIWGIPAEVQDIGKDDYLQYFPVRRVNVVMGDGRVVVLTLFAVSSIGSKMCSMIAYHLYITKVL